METQVLTPYAYDPKKVKLYLMQQRVTGFAADTNGHITGAVRDKCSSYLIRTA